MMEYTFVLIGCGAGLAVYAWMGGVYLRTLAVMMLKGNIGACVVIGSIMLMGVLGTFAAVRCVGRNRPKVFAEGCIVLMWIISFIALPGIEPLSVLYPGTIGWVYRALASLPKALLFSVPPIVLHAMVVSVVELINNLRKKLHS